MGSGNGYEVDLSYLQQAVTQLNGLVSSMDAPTSKAKYSTNLTKNQIGGDGFLEADALYKAHETMKSEITSMISVLQSMVQELQTKTGSAHAAYANQETSTANGFNRRAS
ncbi:hypothetical protein ABH940_002315 [Streptacidiphilus sp. BW17]|jgi:hypothetical protein|uniref:hypothetical protein n=1 Tax=Streptacidiphilus sp. BW17 TaxID=3156274 RepID=UPI003516EE39